MKRLLVVLLLGALAITATGQLNARWLLGKKRQFKPVTMAKRYYNAGGATIVDTGRTYTSDSTLATGGSVLTGFTGLSNSGISDPPPASVMGTLRYDIASFTEAITGLRANGRYKLRVFSVFHGTNYAFDIIANGTNKGNLSVATPADDYQLKEFDCFVQADGSGNLSIQFTSTSTFALVVAFDLQEAGKIALGSGTAISDFAANTGITIDGSNVTNSGTPDTSGLTNPAPAAVYKATRQVSSGDLNITLPDIEDNSSNYFLRLHFYGGAGVGETVKNDSLWLTRVLGVNALPSIVECYAKSNASHQIALKLTDLGSSIKNISGVEYYRQDPPTDAVTVSVINEGDSITEGSPDYAHPFPKQFAAFVTANYYKYQEIVSFDPSRTVRVRDVGEAGQPLSTMVTDATAQVDHYYDAALTKNIVVFLGGSNNLAPDSAATIQSTIQSYGTARRGVGFEFYVGTILPRTDITGSNETKRQAVNTWLRANWATFADGLIDFAAIPEMSDPTNATYYADGVHPTEAGYALMAALQNSVLALRALAITTSSPLTPVNLGDTFTGTFAATAGTEPYTWDNPSGRPTGMSISSSGVRSGTATAAGAFTWVETVTDSVAATATKSFTLVVTDPLAALGDLLDLTGLEITPVSLTVERLTCDFGSGYGESASVGTGSGLWGWELSADVLTDAAAYHDLIAGVPSFQYYTQFYLDHTEGLAGEIFRIDFRGKQYHASFADDSIAGTMETYDLFTLSGVKLKMRRMFGVVYSADGSIDVDAL